MRGDKCNTSEVNVQTQYQRQSNDNINEDTDSQRDPKTAVPMHSSALDDIAHMDIEVTVDDSKAYTKPWTVTLHQVIALDTDLLDFVCADNEKDDSPVASLNEIQPPVTLRQSAQSQFCRLRRLQPIQ